MSDEYERLIRDLETLFDDKFDPMRYKRFQLIPGRGTAFLALLQWLVRTGRPRNK